jgi:hypothetical protein
MSAHNKQEDPFKKQITEHLESVAQKDKLFAITLKKPNKNIDECINYIYQEVRKAGRCGWLDDEIYQMAIHYYDEDDIKGIKPINARVSHTPEKPKDDIQKIKEEAIKNSTATQKQQQPVPISKSKKKTKTVISIVQPSLFD